VLRDAHSLASGSTQTIELTDPHLERGWVIRYFLEAITSLKLPEQALVSSARLVSLVRLLVKWDCDAVLETLLLQLRESHRVGKYANTWAVWVAGAETGDMETCLAALTRFDRLWRSAPAHDLNVKKPHASVFDPTGWSIDIWSSGIPVQYLAALARAFGDVGATAKLADTFKSHFESLSKNKMGE
jgi:hypothetical protein